jgi:hypothetical protein
MLLGEPEIRDLENSIAHENILRLDVAVNDIFIAEVLEAAKNLGEVVADF